MSNLASIFLGFGLAAMFGLPGAGSSIAMVIAGSAVVGATRKRSDAFGQTLVLSALPASQGLYGFVCYFLYSSVVTPEMSLYNAAVVFGAGLTIGVVGFFSSVKQGQVIATGINAIGSGHDVFGNTLILAAFPELLSILGLVVAILMKNLLT
jgi:V/A-type H+-transporting ATPase subunit K